MLNANSAIIDAESTMVMSGNEVKVITGMIMNGVIQIEL